MTSKFSLRNLFGSRGQGSPAASRTKLPKPTRRKYVPWAELLEDRVVPAVLTVTTLADSGVGSLAP